jgi:hypothetical protein
MNHEEQVILYAANQLDKSERAAFESHLVECSDCQEELNMWSAVSEEISASNAAVTAPAHLADSALEMIHRPSALRRSIRQAVQLLKSQSFLVHRELFPASAAVMALGVVVALLSGHMEVMYFIAPLVAAASLSILFGAEHDPAYELILATSTSPWKVLLARLSIVSAYNLLLVLGVAAVLLLVIPPDILGLMIFGWLAPMAFLSALALLLSLRIGTSNAIAITYFLWVAQYIPYKFIDAWMDSPAWLTITSVYQQFWQNPMLLLLLSIPLFVLALWSANRPAFRLSI